MLDLAGDSRFEGRERVRYTRDQLLQLREAVKVADEILKIKQDFEVELFGEDKSWSRGESNPPNYSQNRYSEPDNRDWFSRSAQFPPAGDERSRELLRGRDLGNRFDSRQQEANKFNRQEQFNPQISRAQNSSTQGGGSTPALVKAEVPWSAKRGNLSEKDHVLKSVKGILNKLTPEKYDLLKGQLIDSGITSADILKGVISLIFEKAVLEPTFCPMYSLLCSDLNDKLPSFPSDEPGGKDITFKRVLLNNCQEAFEGADKLREEVRLMTAPEQEMDRRDKERMAKLRTLGDCRYFCFDHATGCLLYGALLDDIAIDLPKAPNNFGEIIGRLILAGGLDFKVVKEILKKMEDDLYQKAVFDAATKTISLNPSGQGLLDASASEVEACQNLF
ncbi:hypothetical protein GOBAR_DD23349 [Gossypium barbadense]|nr:hypothetical protein GOBAR_DD23349 [Gossypium barbadense]